MVVTGKVSKILDSSEIDGDYHPRKFYDKDIRIQGAQMGYHRSVKGCGYKRTNIRLQKIII